MSEWDGVPPNPEQSGWHWLQEGERDPQPFEWCSGFKNWWLGGDEDYGGGWQPTAKRYRYLGPVATPEETAAQAARIAELEAALNHAKRHFLDNNPIKAFVEVCTALAFSRRNSAALAEGKE